MEVNDQTLGILRDLLLNALSPDNATRRNAENYIKSQEAQKGFPVLVLSLIQRLIVSNPNPQDLVVRQSASVLFKNVVKNHWMHEDDPNSLISPEDKEIIKTHVVELMTTAPIDVQKQLSEAVTLISSHDFPDRWPNLLPQLVAKLHTDDIMMKKGVMLTANSIMKRFRYVFKSDELYSVLVICLNSFQEPLLQQFVHNHALLLHAANNKAQVEALLETQRLIARIFFSLNWQDIPEYFEDHIAEWMTEFSKYLTYSNPLVTDDDQDYEPGPIEILQTAIIENLNLYATRYEEIFEPYLKHFAEVLWTLLLHVSQKPKFDYLAVGALKFLTSVASKQMNINLFTDAVLKDIIEHIIIKNLFLTENDENLFEENIYEYIQKDFEGSDTDTRRRSAMEFIRALMKFFAPQVTALSLQYISMLLQAYQGNRAKFQTKDVAIHLFLAISLTNVHGSGLEVSPAVDIHAMLREHILPELILPSTPLTPVVGSGGVGGAGLAPTASSSSAASSSSSSSSSAGGAAMGAASSSISLASIVPSPTCHDLIRADCIKFLCIFRQHWSYETLNTFLPVLTTLTGYTSNLVVQTYAASTLERMFTMREVDPRNSAIKRMKLQKRDLLPWFERIVVNLFGVLTSANPEHATNEYVMKTLLRCLITIGGDCVSILSFIIPQLVQLIERVCKNPINPHYNHYLFECLATIVHNATSASSSSSSSTSSTAAGNPSPSSSSAQVNALCRQFESALFPPFQMILAQDVIEFVPYCFQIFAQLLYVQTGPLSDPYKALFVPLLSPILWEKKGNVPALTDLVRAYLVRAMGEIVALQQLQAVLGVFQKLLASKSSEVYAFALLNTIFLSCPTQSLAPYLNTLFSLLLQRMMESVKESKTTRYARLFLHSMCIFSLQHTAPLLYQTLEGLTPNLMAMIVRNIWSPNRAQCAQQYATGVDNKLMLIGGSMLLCETPIMQDLEVWGLGLKAMIALLPQSSASVAAKDTEDEELLIQEPTSGADGVYSKLAHANIPALLDTRPDVPSGGSFLVQSLAAFLQSHPGPFLNYFKTQLEPAEVAALQAVCQQHGILLP